MMTDKSRRGDNLLWKYAGFTAQLLIALGLAVYLGIKTDGWLKSPFPVAVWLLPLVIIIGLIIKAIKDTAPKKNKRPDENQ